MKKGSDSHTPKKSGFEGDAQGSSRDDIEKSSLEERVRAGGGLGLRVWILSGSGC